MPRNNRTKVVGYPLCIWVLPSAVYVLAAALQTKFFTHQEINLGSMPQTSVHVLSTVRNRTTGFLVKRFRKCCRSTVFMVRLSLAVIWGAGRKNIISDRFSAKTAISAQR